MLPSTLLTVSASAEFWFSRLNNTPHTITVCASHPPLSATTQHSLPGARYGLPGPVSHRRDHAGLTWRTSNPVFLVAFWIASLALAMTCRLLRGSRKQQQIAVDVAHDEVPRAPGLALERLEERHAGSLKFKEQLFDLVCRRDRERGRKQLLAIS